MQRVGWLMVVGSLVVAACSSDSKPTVTPSSSSSASGGAASLMVAGDAGLAGPVGAPEVTCNYPDVDGLRIAVLAKAPDTQFTYRIAVTADKVTVLIDAGAGDQFFERRFEGPGVTAFDAGKGVRVDAQLTEAPATGGTGGGSIGVAHSIVGSIDCGGQTTGSSTITITGETAAGRFENATLDPALVECYFGSGEVIVLGVARAGDTKVGLLVSITSQGLGLEEEVRPSGQRRYGGTSLAGATITTTGGHANGDVVEKDATPPHTLHIEGDAVCGTPLRG